MGPQFILEDDVFILKFSRFCDGRSVYNCNQNVAHVLPAIPPFTPGKSSVGDSPSYPHRVWACVRSDYSENVMKGREENSCDIAALKEQITVTASSHSADIAALKEEMAPLRHQGTIAPTALKKKKIYILAKCPKVNLSFEGV